MVRWPLAVEAGLVGEEAEAEVVVVTLGGFGEGGEVGGFEDVDAGEGTVAMRTSELVACSASQ